MAPPTPKTIEAYWSLPAPALFAALGSRPEGLSDEEASSRRGGRPLARAASPTLAALRDQLNNPLAWLLLFAAFVSAASSDFTEASVIASILVLGGLAGFLEGRRAGLAVEALQARLSKRARVRRGGVERTLAQSEVVPGDVVLVAPGSLVPADCVVLEARGCFAEQAALTGESFPIEKTARHCAADAGLEARANVLFLGTSVRSGQATLLAVRTGGDTELGTLSRHVAKRPPVTEFERGVRRFGLLLVRVMLVLALVVAVASVLRDLPMLESMLFAIALAVGLAPEMLPAILAVTLSHGAREMAKQGVIVRHLPAIENLGSMDVLCTDKTGTLTVGVVELERSLDPVGAESPRPRMLAAHNAKVEAGSSSPLDQAILAAAPEVETARSLGSLPFDFERKRVSVAIELEGAPSLITKGALDRVLEICDRVRSGGDVLPLDDAGRDRLHAAVLAHAARGARVLGVASKPLEAARAPAMADEASMIFEGMLTFADAPKPGVDAALQALARLGVTVKVITGDHRDVARHVAEAIGLRVEGVLGGREIAALDDAALAARAETTTIFAEVDPSQKERIVQALRRGDHVVGFMGDGINDALALHVADVGISVDGAVDVAREAAGFVLLSNDLGVLARGIAEGRVTFANTLKYVLTTESANLGNMVTMAGASLFLPFLPLLAQQVLLNNFLSDLPAMALARDGVDPEMVSTPRRWDLRFVRRFMIAFGLVSTAFDALTFFVLAHVLAVPVEGFRTGWFVESLLTELLVALVVRTRRPFWRSRPSNALLALTGAITVIALALPYLPIGGWFALVPLPLPVLGTLVAITLGYVMAVELLKRAILARLMG
ncbi:MAG: magnesium-translocating P-type ATPase [Sandaracinus sp.]